jgi:hypothetical protein
MRLSDLTRVLKEGFGVLSEVEPRRSNFSVRLTMISSEFRSLRIMTHNKNGVSVSPLCIKHALEKFEIPESGFRQAYNKILIGRPFATATGTDDRSPT